MIQDLDNEKKLILDVILNEIREHYRNDIAIVACYGSRVTGTANAKSDIDFYFIPKSEKGYEMSVQFIIDDIGYDFWPLSWERAENIAALQQPLASIIADAQILYSSAEADIQRFSFLKQKIEDAVHPENRDRLLVKAREILSEVKALFLDAYTCVDNYGQVRSICSQILEKLNILIAYANSTYPRKGAVNFRNEAKSLCHLPNNYFESIEQIVRCSDVYQVIEITANLIKSVESIIQSKAPSEDCELSNGNAKGFYEELKSMYNKLIMACDEKDHIKVYFAANAIGGETKQIFGKQYTEFPELMIPIGDNFKQIRKLAADHEQVMFKILRRSNIDVNILKDADDLSTFFTCRWSLQHS